MTDRQPLPTADEAERSAHASRASAASALRREVVAEVCIAMVALAQADATLALVARLREGAHATVDANVRNV